MGTYIGLAIIAAVFFAYKQRAVLPKVDPSYIAVALVAIAFVAYQERSRFVLVPPTVTSSVDAVAAVKAKISGSDAVEFGNFCLALSDGLEADSQGEVYKTVEDFKSVNSQAGKGSLRRYLKQADGVTPKYPGLAEAFDAAVASATGGKDTFFSAEQRANLVKLLRDIHAALT